MSSGWRVCILGGVLSFSLSIVSLVTAELCQIYYLVIVQIPYKIVALFQGVHQTFSNPYFHIFVRAVS